MPNTTEYQLQHWDDDRSGEIVGVSVFCLICVSVTVFLRIYAQSMVTRAWRCWDTWFILWAAVFTIALSGITIYIIKYGFGKHTLRVIMEDNTAPDDLATIFMYGYITSILQAPGIMCIKLALLAFYARVFGLLHHDRFFTRGLYACFVICVLLGIGTTIEFIVQCIPAQVFWNRIYLMFPGGHTDGPTSGYCMDQVSHVTVPVVLDLVTEIMIMILPAKILWNLQLPTRKKVGLAILFGLGIFVCATNIVRIKYYASMINGGDLAWDDIDAFIWTNVQMTVGIVCASIPACTPFLRLCYGRRDKSSSSSQPAIPLENRSKALSNRWSKSHDKLSSHEFLTDPRDCDGERMC
ncbi:hypothetical protein BS50DRAFT_522471 [Corynespora cassiicola Philippines]|uniref:Rhodopsin domain-containing protein n=1 Tax=Corynespora cassiicola Philippines TaxID=1448308 RepID=A0A2T2NQL9_CORCC|nr:hypothetical protein BS50DRAFT_522471 [Corynespora cassiicola Philippines]